MLVRTSELGCPLKKNEGTPTEIIVGCQIWLIGLKLNFCYDTDTSFYNPLHFCIMPIGSYTLFLSEYHFLLSEMGSYTLCVNIFKIIGKVLSSIEAYTFFDIENHTPILSCSIISNRCVALNIKFSF